MPTDTHIRDAAHLMMGSIAVPAVPYALIHKRAAQRRPIAEAVRPHRRRVAIAALGLALIPAVGYSIVRYETRSREALQAHGGWAPPPPPAAVVARLAPHAVTLSQAQAEAGFSLTAPGGLPADAALLRIEMSPTGMYDGSSHQWHAGPAAVVFLYRRTDGRTFAMTAQRYNAHSLPGRYIFEDRGPDAHGDPILVKHERSAWTNGDQLMLVTEDGLSKDEAIAIAHAMNGTVLKLPLHTPHSGGTLRLIRP
jgi:hypothetical protein